MLSPFSSSGSVEHLGAKVGECRPGDQHSGDEGEDAEDTHDGDGVAGFDGIDDVGCAVHDLSPMGVARSVGEAWVDNSWLLVEQFGADVGECRPGDQDGRDEGEHAESGNHEHQVRTFDGIHKAALSFHDALLLLRLFNYC